MSAPIRVQLSRKKGARLPTNTANVARPSRWGNPFRSGIDGTAAEVVERYALHVGPMGSGELDADDLAKLRGRNLACWCALDQPCHADVLLELANREVPS